MHDAEEIYAALASGTELLRGQYKIIRPLGQGGFGLTYLAHDSLNRTVVIKECFPSQICGRNGIFVQPFEAQDAPYFSAILEQFQEEALRLAELDHPGIVGVHQTFAENGTAYTAMDFVEGVDLLDLVERAPGRLTRSTIDSVLRQVLDALRYLHDRGILHRDIAPDNLILSETGQVTLIDFGAAYASSEHDDGQKRRMLAVKDGYSPPEFYSAEGSQGSYSDIYSLGALCHLMFVGDPPPDAQARVEMTEADQGDPYAALETTNSDLDIRLLIATDRALTLDAKERLRSADDWIRVMDGPVPKPLAEFDPAVVGVIKDLVSDTNRVLQPGLPQALKAQRKIDQPIAPKPQKQKQYVDVFGDPIEDVEAYLAEQDKLCSARARQSEASLKHGGMLTAAAGGRKAPRNKSGKASLFHRFCDRFRARHDVPETRILQT
ncbi:serine/threonine protein kinase [Shimia sp.]|uniref:serine/threonine protein kinase n=1 Tax=Shimia sp. TaxID=1954381 RepID=UPI003BAAE26E